VLLMLVEHCLPVPHQAPCAPRRGCNAPRKRQNSPGTPRAAPVRARRAPVQGRVSGSQELVRPLRGPAWASPKLGAG